jgi:hypothetical protein
MPKDPSSGVRAYRDIPRIPAMSPEQVACFWALVTRGGDNTCWRWIGKHTPLKYGRWVMAGRLWMAHRVAWELTRGAIPRGLVLDHLCRNPQCVNPGHLEAVTQQQNTLRGTGPTAENAKKTHRGHGHEYTPENTRINGRGRRECRQCIRRILADQWKRGVRHRGPSKQSARFCAVCRRHTRRYRRLEDGKSRHVICTLCDADPHDLGQQAVCGAITLEGLKSAADAEPWTPAPASEPEPLQSASPYKRIPPFTESAQTRFWSFVERVGGNCWPWKGVTGPSGYGTFRNYRAHRVAYTLMRGPIPDGLTLDHLCRNPSCVNPQHLEPVTSVVNTMRGTSPMALNARKTHCPKGHLLGPRLVRSRPGRPSEGRICPTCRYEFDKRKWTNPERYENRRKRGLCIQCNTPSVRFRCDRCRTLHNERNKGRSR